MAKDDRRIYLPEHISVHAPRPSDPAWMKAFPALLSITTWTEESPGQPEVVVIPLDEADVKLVVEQLRGLVS